MNVWYYQMSIKLECICGKQYKTEKGYNKHTVMCTYIDLDIKKVLRIGQLINNVDKNIFYTHYGKVSKLMKTENISRLEAMNICLNNNILKYKKMIWDIYGIWKDRLVVSEYNIFVRWVFKTYRDISILSLKSILTNEKIIYRFDVEHTFETINKRIDESLIFINERNSVFYNNDEFVDNILSGTISIYYILFNDWLAIKWFSNLENVLQRDLLHYVEIASKNIINHISTDEYNTLHVLANTVKPNIQDF